MFSITPRIFLHNWLAAHKDAGSQVKINGQDYIGYEVYNCNCDQIVAASPFTQVNGLFIFDVPNRFKLQQESIVPFYSSCTQFFLNLRGPPTGC